MPTTLTHIIEEVAVSGEEIHNLCMELEPHLGANKQAALIACLSIAIAIMDPNVSQEEIREGVSGASKWICLFLDGKGTDGLMQEPRTVN